MAAASRDPDPVLNGRWKASYDQLVIQTRFLALASTKPATADRWIRAAPFRKGRRRAGSQFSMGPR